ncbi:hypothetical protein SteCoe_6862 [Stentor coeruleus]|uniref:Kinesin motor domain-containing protein n=1 Tax=Stentor coeruleus TaxID=5963 RepID=A0A1R2CNY6_9CILI|nr:hypothetical protein SteCoe_6862 [Stentor coeruleus]
MSIFPKVAIRIRPINSNGSSEYENAIIYENNIIKVTENQESSEIQFDKVFEPLTPQEQIFNFIYPLIESCEKGLNSTIITYGQTGSGKSYTMFGNSVNYGIIPRVIFHIFRVLSSDCIIRFSLIDIYNEKITDLLEEAKNPLQLSTRQNVDDGIYIENLSEYIVQSPEDAINLMTKGINNLYINHTDMSIRSLKIHIMCQIKILNTRPNEDGRFFRSKIIFCDLAGSQIGGRSYDNPLTNKSILVLNNVINKLTKDKCGHIPYRYSKLTFLLKESLEGKNQLGLIANINPIRGEILETYRTIRFASEFKKINIKSQVHENSLEEYKAIENFEIKAKVIKLYVGDFHIKCCSFKSNCEEFPNHQSMIDVEEIMKQNKKKILTLGKVKFIDNNSSMAYTCKKQIDQDEKLNYYLKSKSCRFHKSLDLDTAWKKRRTINKRTMIKRK